MEGAEGAVIAIVIIIALLVLFGIGKATIPPTQPQPPQAATPTVDLLTVDRAVLLARLDAELQRIEASYRASNVNAAAEGVAVARVRVIEFLRGYR